MKAKKPIRKICLVYPNQTPLPRWFDKVSNIPKEPVLLPPLGLLYAAAATKRDVAVLDNRVERLGLEDLVDRLSGFDAVGFSGTIFDARQAVDAARFLEKEGIPTIYGGPNATVNPGLYKGVFSAVLRGEAEEALDPLLDALESGNRPAEYEDLEGSWVARFPFRVKDLDAVPEPDRSLVDMDRYLRREETYLPGLEPVDTVVSSRGCPYDCTFCSSKVIWQRRSSFRSPASVASEMRSMAEEYGSRGFYFREDNFTVNRRRLLEMCDALEPLGFPWVCESRADTLDRETVRRMRKAGCRGIWFGVESTSNETLKRIKKNITIEEVKETVRLCREEGIRTGGGFILGFPHEGRADLLRTVQESREIGLDFVFYNRCWAIPKSALHDEIKAKGLDRYEFEGIVLPDTEYLHADEVTEIYWNAVTSWKMRLAAKVLPVRVVETLDRAACKVLESLGKGGRRG